MEFLQSVLVHDQPYPVLGARLATAGSERRDWLPPVRLGRALHQGSAINPLIPLVHIILLVCMYMQEFAGGHNIAPRPACNGAVCAADYRCGGGRADPASGDGLHVETSATESDFWSTSADASERVRLAPRRPADWSGCCFNASRDCRPLAVLLMDDDRRLEHARELRISQPFRQVRARQLRISQPNLTAVYAVMLTTRGRCDAMQCDPMLQCDMVQIQR